MRTYIEQVLMLPWNSSSKAITPFWLSRNSTPKQFSIGTGKVQTQEGTDHIRTGEVISAWEFG
ncbi:Uncharacterised protein [Klebsiella pneumoniae]|nr:Uncharacterised protein [Klebsiella pneumoniae]